MPRNTPSIKLWDRRRQSAKKRHDEAVVNFKRWEQWAKGQLPDGFKPYFTGQYAHRSALVPKTLIEDGRRFKNKCMGMLFSTEDYIQLSGIEEQQSLVELNQELLKFQFNNRFWSYRKFRSKVHEYWWIYGVVWALDEWIRDSETSYEGYSKRLISPYRFIPASYVDSNGKIPYFIVQSVFLYGDLKKMAGQKGWKSAYLNEVLSGLAAEFPKDQVDKDVLEIRELDIDPKEDRDIYPVLVEECFDMAANTRTTIINEKVDFGTVRLDEPNCGLHWWEYGKIGNDPYPASLIGILEDEWFEMFLWRNLSLDLARLEAGGYGITDDTQGTVMIQAIPGQFQKVGNIDRYKPLSDSLRANSKIPFEHAQVLREEFKNFLNLADIFAGRDPSRKETATRDLAIIRNAGGDLEGILTDQQDLFDIPILQQALTVNRKKLPDLLPQLYVKQIGIERKEQIMDNWTISMSGVTVASSRELAQAILGQKLTIWAGIPQIAREYDWSELAELELDLLRLPPGLKSKIHPPSTVKLAPIVRENQMMLAGIRVPVIEEDPHELHYEHQLPVLQGLYQMQATGFVAPELQNLFKQTGNNLEDVISIFEEHVLGSEEREGHEDFMKPLSGLPEAPQNGRKPITSDKDIVRQNQSRFKMAGPPMAREE